MDILLRNGDTVTDVTGEPIHIDSMDEIVQRVKICIGIEKGSFIYNKDLGLERPRSLENTRDIKRFEALLSEAVMPVGCAHIEVINAEFISDRRISASINIRCGAELRMIEVTI